MIIAAYLWGCINEQ